MNYETVDTQIKNGCAYIFLNRPNRSNSFNLQLGDELYEVLNNAALDKGVKSVVIRGVGNSFCAGGDVKEMYYAKDKSLFLRDLTKAIHKCVIKIREMPKPVIAGVNGSAFGAGFSLALACDIIIAVKDTKFGTAFIGIGLAPGCGTQLFTSIVGYHRACEYILTSKVFNSEHAEQLGLVNKVVDNDLLDVEIRKFVDVFNNFSSIAVGKAKMLINKSLENNFIDHLDLESSTASLTAGSNDFKEGVTAFVEKRKPVFKDK